MEGYFIVFNNHGKAIGLHHFDEFGARTWEMVSFPTYKLAKIAAESYMESRQVDWPYKIYKLADMPTVDNP